MGIDKLSDSKVFRANESFQFNLLCFLVQEYVDLVLEIQPFVEEKSLDVVVCG